ncbi:RNA polymerase sigma factor [Domibacillus enclensis]|uniref:RNA polymerase sigma factor, sigma-70 family n=1 Tax=Domibacillus enclensis TaxID=1017273 RepID=A0A1N7D0X0_9BACI|nr:sigma factor-like helix-turn-helix DNA-binding protein [Domibacillus enclensis]OXS72961.1 hypothetical protein B1B05_18970 [Domibacillus enclensis]SIR69568.1 RNA polymerase sigma factor, sigma-70 family [Domibacillus enclensis]
MKLPNFILENKLLKEFFSCEENKYLFENYRKTKNSKIKRQLDQRFKIFHLKIKAITYMDKLIYFEAIHFDKKVRSREEKVAFILDEEMEDKLKYIEVLQGASIEPIPMYNLEDYIEDELLYNVVRSLSEKQKNILLLLFVENQKEKEVASFLGITQQAVSKQKNAALSKIKKELKIHV